MKTQRFEPTYEVYFPNVTITQEEFKSLCDVCPTAIIGSSETYIDGEEHVTDIDIKGEDLREVEAIGKYIITVY